MLLGSYRNKILIISDFAHFYSIRLHVVGNALTWQEFYDLLYGLFAISESRIGRAYAPRRDNVQPTEGGDE